MLLNPLLTWADLAFWIFQIGARLHSRFSPRAPQHRPYSGDFQWSRRVVRATGAWPEPSHPGVSRRGRSTPRPGVRGPLGAQSVDVAAVLLQAAATEVGEEVGVDAGERLHACSVEAEDVVGPTARIPGRERRPLDRGRRRLPPRPSLAARPTLRRTLDPGPARQPVWRLVGQ